MAGMRRQLPEIKLGPPVEAWNRLPENMALVRVVRRHRQKLGLSLNQLADRTMDRFGHPQVSRQMLGFFEADKYLPGLDVLGLIARALGTSSAHLLFEAQQWIARLPACCHACKYACMARGRLIWLSAHRQCTRPQKALSAPAASLPDTP
jgi:transcriptional regulator with XRE-family HTH domain